MQLLWDVLSGKKRTGVTECTLLVLLWSRDLTALGSLADLFARKFSCATGCTQSVALEDLLVSNTVYAT